MSKSVKLPKHVADVKIPKSFRHALEALLEEASSPAARRLIAGALIAAAAALVRDLSDDDEPAAGRNTAGDRPKPPIDMGALLGFAATNIIGGLKAAGERKADGPTKPGEA